MIKQVLVIGYDGKTKRKTKWECLHCAEGLHILSLTPDAMKRLTEENTYVSIIFFTHGSDDAFAVRSIRNLTDIPILVLAEEYKGVEKIDILEAGADEYIRQVLIIFSKNLEKSFTPVIDAARACLPDAVLFFCVMSGESRTSGNCEAIDRCCPGLPARLRRIMYVIRTQ